MKTGAVGHAIPGVQLRIAEDGEVLARGDNTMLGESRNGARPRILH